MSRIKLFLFSIACASQLQYAAGQGIHYTPFYTTPTMLNPAFTGMFDGKVRVGGLYRNQWASVTVPYLTLGLSADLPVLSWKNGSYLAAGLQVIKDQAGDGNLSNFTSTASVAYHRSFCTGKILSRHPLDIGIGLQTGYTQSSIGLNHLYFNSASPWTFTTQFYNPGWAFSMGNNVRAYPISAGISISQSVHECFNYTVGICAQNINAPHDAKEVQTNEALGLDGHYSFTAGANWVVGNRLTVRPAFLYLAHSSGGQCFGGSELCYRVSRNTTSIQRGTSLFVGGWYRTGDWATLAAGVEHKSIKFGLGYDRHMSNANVSSDGSGGMELTLKYTAPGMGLKQPRRNVPCNRF
jgi:type IX secretion system PorP/SprF family membrane protein